MTRKKTNYKKEFEKGWGGKVASTPANKYVPIRTYQKLPDYAQPVMKHKIDKLRKINFKKTFGT